MLFKYLAKKWPTQEPQVSPEALQMDTFSQPTLRKRRRISDVDLLQKQNGLCYVQNTNSHTRGIKEKESIRGVSADLPNEVNLEIFGYFSTLPAILADLCFENRRWRCMAQGILYRKCHIMMESHEKKQHPCRQNLKGKNCDFFLRTFHETPHLALLVQSVSFMWLSGGQVVYGMMDAIVTQLPNLRHIVLSQSRHNSYDDKKFRPNFPFVNPLHFLERIDVNFENFDATALDILM